MVEIRLDSVRPEDSEMLYRWINDRELVELSGPFAAVDRDAHERWLDNALHDRPDAIVRAIRLGPEAELIGICQLRGIDRDPGSAELRIRIGEARHRGRGHGARAVQELMKTAFEELGLIRIWLQVREDNRRAIAAYNRAGFSRADVLPDAVEIAGTQHRFIVMEAFAAGRGPARP